MQSLNIFKEFFPQKNHVEIFRTDGIRAVNYQLSDKAIQELSHKWQEFVNQLSAPPPPAPEQPQGIVICGGGVRFMTCAWVNIKMLRHHGCTLPIELWHLNNEMTGDLSRELRKYGVECRNLNEITSVERDPLKRTDKQYAMKPLSILNSRFSKILYLDADNVCTCDPTYLFDHEIFKTHGAVFWPDFWRTDKENPIWRVTDSYNFSIFEQDSGQLLIDKTRCWKELNLCCYFNQHPGIYHRMLHFDKDTFKFAWLALKSPFFMVPFETSSCGHIALDGNFVGTTMVQYDYSGKIIFLHRNIVKWDITRNDELIWQQLRKFKESAKVKEYYLGRRANTGETGMDLRGDIDIIDFRELFPGLESTCLSYLRELRESPVYAHFLISFYLLRFRGGELPK